MTYFMPDYWDLKIKGLYQTIAYALGVAPLAMAYVGIFMLSFQTHAQKYYPCWRLLARWPSVIISSKRLSAVLFFLGRV